MIIIFSRMRCGSEQYSYMDLYKYSTSISTTGESDGNKKYNINIETLYDDILFMNTQYPPVCFKNDFFFKLKYNE